MLTQTYMKPNRIIGQKVCTVKLFLYLSFWACAEKTTESTPPDSGIIVGPPPEPEDTSVADTAEDTGIEDTAIEDTGINDTAQEDTSIADSAEDTSTEPAQEDTSVEIVQMPDFSLPDVNPYSPTLGDTISVRDQIEKISGWYFIKAT